MSLPITRARYGSGLMYAVKIPGDEDIHILCDERPYDELMAAPVDLGEALAIIFRGVTAGHIVDGKEVPGVVGVGVVCLGPGVLIRYHDDFVGPDRGDEEDDDEEHDPEPRRPEPPRATGPAPISSLSDIRRK